MFLLLLSQVGSSFSKGSSVNTSIILPLVMSLTDIQLNIHNRLC